MNINVIKDILHHSLIDYTKVDFDSVQIRRLCAANHGIGLVRIRLNVCTLKESDRKYLKTESCHNFHWMEISL
jgi:hypothetical protein